MDIYLLRAFFMWCSIINIVLLLLSFAFFWLGGEWIYRMHSKWFKIPREQFDALWYGILGFWKISIFLFNIVPYVVLCIIG